ncbi:MAG TPA: hypothetical protein PLV68_18145, partial [Ilumatobacteraceae bacterium]|nr:hypothetical protein [Ilumatobacteraceae bacterium]
MPDPDGLCPTAAAGNDCSVADDRVTSNDLTTFFYAVSASDLQGSPVQPVGEVILEVVAHPAGGAVLAWEIDSIKGVPAICLTAGEGAARPSSISTDPDGSIRLVCNLGNFNTADLHTAPISLRASGASPNGSSFTIDARAYSADNNAQLPAELAGGPIEISAAPRFNLGKRGNTTLGDPPGRAVQYSNLVNVVNPVTGLAEPTYTVGYGVAIEATGDGRGAEALTDQFGFLELIDPSYAPWGARPRGCIARNTVAEMRSNGQTTLPLPGGPAVPDAPYAVADSGTWSCLSGGDQTSGLWPISITAADTSGSHYPSQDVSGNALTHKLVAVQVIEVYYPISALMKAHVPGWNDGDPVVVGNYPVTNCLGGFDPVSVSGVSNYGAGFEPGWDGTSASGDNCRTHDIIIRAPGGFWKGYGQVPDSGDPLTVDVSVGYPCLRPELIPTGAAQCWTGDGFTAAHEELYGWLVMGDDGSPLAMAKSCVTCGTTRCRRSLRTPRAQGLARWFSSLFATGSTLRTSLCSMPSATATRSNMGAWRVRPAMVGRSATTCSADRSTSTPGASPASGTRSRPSPPTAATRPRLPEPQSSPPIPRLRDGRWTTSSSSDWR